MFGNPNHLPGLTGREGGVKFNRRGQNQPLTPSIASSGTTSSTDNDGRLELMEQRLLASEQAYRTLMDEMLRQQQHSKLGNESELRNERDLRNHLESTLRTTQFKLDQLEQRVSRGEVATNDCRSAMTSLSAQIGSIEKNVLTGNTQNDRFISDDMSRRFQSLTQEVNAMKQSRLAADKQIAVLRNNLQDTLLKVDSLSSEVRTSLTSHSMPDNFLTSAGSGMNTISSGTALSLETKVARLQKQTSDIQSHVLRLNRDRENAENRQNHRIEEMMSEMSELIRQRDADQQDMEGRCRQLVAMTTAGGSSAAVNSGAGEVSRLTRVVNTMQTDFDTKLRNINNRIENAGSGENLYSVVTAIKREAETRLAREITLKDQIETAMKQARAYCDEELEAVTKQIEKDEQKNQERFKQLNQAVQLVESSFEENKLKTNTEISEQAQEQRKLEKMMDAKLEDLSDRLRIGMASVQSSEITETLGKRRRSKDYTADLERIQNKSNEGIRQSLTKPIADLEKKYSRLQTRLDQQDEVIEHKLKQIGRRRSSLATGIAVDPDANMAASRLEKRVDTLTLAQSRADQRLQQAENTLGANTRKLEQFEDTVEEKCTQLKHRIDTEVRTIKEDTKQVKEDLSTVKGPSYKVATNVGQLQKDVDDNKSAFTKLAEVLQIVKSTTTAKIKQEMKTRERELGFLQKDFDQLEKRAGDLEDKLN